MTMSPFGCHHDNFRIHKCRGVTWPRRTLGATLAILEERGIFWWNDEKIPEGQFAPNSAIGGKLTIEDSGSIRLDLDGMMTGKGHPFEILSNTGKSLDRNIQGLLKGDAGHVLLLEVISNAGSVSTSNLSQERYLALGCLVGGQHFRPDHKRPLSFHSLTVDLSGFEDWLMLRGITINRNQTKLTAKYKRKRVRRYTLPFGRVSIEYGLSGPHFGEWRERTLTLVETSCLHIKPANRMSLEDSQVYFQHIEELLILLTSSDRKLDWPTLTIGRAKQKAKLYFMRLTSDTKAPGTHECLINFTSIENSFGRMLAELIEKREQFGPGIYLYMGTRRGMKMFVEHRFVNLIWGLEAFDRRGRGEDQADNAMSEKIARILSQISANKDRKWLQGKLRHAAEPNLEDRLFNTFSTLALPFETKELRRFCKECQDCRNDISHFGGVRRKGQSYDDFMRELDKKSRALAALYHFLLLMVIGVDQGLLDFHTNRSRPLSRMMTDMSAVGILRKKGELSG